MRGDRHKKNKWLRVVLFFIAGIMLIVGGIFGYYAYRANQFVQEVSVVQDERPQDQDQVDYNQIQEKKPFSILLLGMDMDDGLTSRTDTIMVASINPDSEDIKLVSIPRDTLVETDFGLTEKINAMYTYGGIDLMIKEVEKLLDIPISHYAILDFQGLADLVDAVGGIRVKSDLAFTESNSLGGGQPIEIEEGWQELNGEQALGFARMRKQDPKGDYGRQERQQQVIKALARKFTTMNVLAKFNPILNAISPHLTTNLDGEQMLTLAMNYRETAQDIETFLMDGSDTTVYFPHYGFNVYGLEPDPSSLEDLSDTFQDHLKVRGRHDGRASLQTDEELDS